MIPWVPECVHSPGTWRTCPFSFNPVAWIILALPSRAWRRSLIGSSGNQSALPTPGRLDADPVLVARIPRGRPGSSRSGFWCERWESCVEIKKCITKVEDWRVAGGGKTGDARWKPRQGT